MALERRSSEANRSPPRRTPSYLHRDRLSRGRLALFRACSLRAALDDPLSRQEERTTRSGELLGQCLDAVRGVLGDEGLYPSVVVSVEDDVLGAPPQREDRF